MIRIFLNKRLPALSALLLSLGMWGCVFDNIDKIGPDAAAEEEVTITVSIPGAGTPSTRSIADAEGEAAVETIDILVFSDSEGGTPMEPKILTEHIKATIIEQSADKNDNYLVKFKAFLTANSMASRLSIIANASDEVDDAVAAAKAAGNGGVATKLGILESLRFATKNSGGTAEGWKWNAAGPNSYDAIPMYGETTISGITPAMRIDGIKLTRMLARIDVVNSAAGFTLSEVYVVNYNTAGYAAPAWSPVNGDMLTSADTDYPYTNNLDPTLPSTVNQKTGASNAMMYNYATLATAEGMLGEIYTYEAPATTGVENTSGHTNAMCLIVKGTYNNADYYYRIDFTAGADKSGNKPGDSGFNPADVEYMPIYRNHNYVFTISRVDGVGYTQFCDALKSLGVKNNLQVIMHSVSQTGIKNMVWNGQHYVGLADDVTLDYPSGETGKALCATNYAYGWQIDTSKGVNGIEYTDSSDTGWLSASKEGGSASDKSANILLTTLTENYAADRVAYVHIIAGRLSHKLTVTQKWVLIQNPEQWRNTPYVGVFWRHDQKGERILSGYNTGAWSATVDGDGASWLRLTKTFSPDAGWMTENPGNAENYFYDSGQTGWSTTIHGRGSVYFRVCPTTTFDGYNEETNPARYATITVTTTAGSKKVYVRHGEGPDYLMRDGDAGTTSLTSGARPHAAKYSPYNLTSQDFLAPVETESVETGAKGGVLVEYPSQAGAFWQFAAKSADNTASGTKPYIYAWSPSYPVQGAPVTDFTVHYDEEYWGNNSTLADYNTKTMAELYETCPPGYRRPTDGSQTNTAAVPKSGAGMPSADNSEMGQSLWLNPIAGEANTSSANMNTAWGYYADGFFDRRNIGSQWSGQSNSAVDGDKSTVAHIGQLFYNPYNNASLFFPAAGLRLSGGFLYFNGSYGYYSSSSSSSNVSNVVAATVWALNFTKSSSYRQLASRVTGLSVRCVKETILPPASPYFTHDALGAYLVGDNPTFYIKSNISWQLVSTTGSGASAISNQGPSNISVNETTGTAFSLNIEDNDNWDGTTVTFTFRNPNGFMTDQTITFTLVACGSANPIPIGSNGKTYLTTKYNIGGKDACWMVENSEEGEYFTTRPAVSQWYADITTVPSSGNAGSYYDGDFGRYYTWTQAQNACPGGWRLPKKTEISLLKPLVTSGDSNWLTTYNLGGYYLRESDGSGESAQAGAYGRWWALDENDPNTTVYFTTAGSNEINDTPVVNSNTYAVPVRCVRDYTTAP